MTFSSNKTKLVATLGPASNTPEIIAEMIKAGLNIARINFSHGDPKVHQALVENIRAAEKLTDRRIAIMADLPGPKMRIGELESGFIELNKGDEFSLTSEKIIGNKSRVYVSFSKLQECVKPGDKLYLNDGSIELVATAVNGNDVTCRVLVGGELRPRKGLNLPGINLGTCAFTSHDFECLKSAAEFGIDAISQSFVESGEDMKAVREAANSINYYPFILAKIERSNALDHIEDIFNESDGIMVARGDLGVEIPIEQIALAQKRLIREANLRGKPVITATQMLESMTISNRPTRAEASDVSNAILDGTDCVMLSAESATGKFPVESVAMLAKIAAAVEPNRSPHAKRELVKEVLESPKMSIFDFLSASAEGAIERLNPAAIFVPSRTGESVRKLSRFHVSSWIVAISKNMDVCQGLQFSYGVEALHVQADPDDWSDFARKWLQEREIGGEYAIIIQGPSHKHPDRNHRMEVVRLEKAGG